MTFLKVSRLTTPQTNPMTSTRRYDIGLRGHPSHFPSHLLKPRHITVKPRHHSPCTKKSFKSTTIKILALNNRSERSIAYLSLDTTILILLLDHYQINYKAKSTASYTNCSPSQ